MEYKHYPENYKDAVVWTKEDMTFTTLRTDLGHYCSYVRFPRRLFRGAGVTYDGFFAYIPAHGGLTYAEEDSEGVVYGFDCGHAGDEDNPKLKTLAWHKQHIEQVAKALRECKSYKLHYERVKTNEKRAEILDEFRAKYNLKDEGFNFGVGINTLCGKL